jgi:mycothiol synthase
MAELRNAIHLDEIGSLFTDGSEVRPELSSPGFDPATDAFLVFASSGELVGSLLVWAEAPFTRIYLDNYVHPDWRGHGIGTLLLDRSEARAAQIAMQAPDGKRVVLHHGVWLGARSAEQFFAERGYELVRYFHALDINMSESPPEALCPPGIDVRTIDPGSDDRALYEAEMDAFKDHWGFVRHSFELWKHEVIGSDRFDPTLFFVAEDQGEIAGSALCQVGNADDPEAGHVASLSVRRPWRRRGIALALLRHSFEELFRRGYRRVTTGVDSANPTGAVQLYERAGVHTFRQHVVFENVLEAGS